MYHRRGRRSDGVLRKHLGVDLHTCVRERIRDVADKQLEEIDQNGAVIHGGNLSDRDGRRDQIFSRFQYGVGRECMQISVVEGARGAQLSVAHRSFDDRRHRGAFPPHHDGGRQSGVFTWEA